MSKMSDEEAQKKLQAEFEVFRQVRKDYHKALGKRQQLDGQLNENKTVKEQLNLLKEGNEVYKLIGPILVKQDLEEAKQNVKKRIEYITAELERTDAMITSLDEKQTSLCEHLEKMQASLQPGQRKA